MKAISIQWVALRLACLAAVAGLSACAEAEAEAEGDGDLGEIAQAATGYKLDGKYHYITDQFSEACSASTLKVRTSWANNLTAWTNIPRGEYTYVQPAQSSNGAFEWRCGSVFVNGHDYSECDGAPADWVRFYWDPNGSTIKVVCYELCGDGSSSIDCLPY